MKRPEDLSESKRRLLERVLRGEMARATWEAPVQARPPGTTVPLAPSQQHVWLDSQMGDTRFVYNEPVTIHYHGPLDPRVFERSFHEFLRRHEIWRTTFASVDGQVVQVVHPQMAIDIPFCDLSGLPPEDGEAEATRIATADARHPFDLAVGPLLRGRLFKLREDRYRFHLTLHHIIFDGVSLYRTVLPELAAIYQAFMNGEPAGLPEPVLQYGDYALWQARLQESQSVGEQVTYWREQLAGELPVLQLPADHPRPPSPSHRGAMEKFSLPAALWESVKRRSKAESATPYMFLLTSFKAMLYRYSGQADILVGGAIDGRRRSEFHNLIGYFLNMVVLRTKPTASMSFREYLDEVKYTVSGALANGDVPFDRLVRELQPKRDSSSHPFFQTLFSIQPPASPVAPWDLTQMDIATGASKVDLYLELEEQPDHLLARFLYNCDIFDQATIHRMVGHWQTLLQAAADDPGTLLRDLPMLTREESQWMRNASAGSRRELPPATIHGSIEAQAARTPEAVAIECQGERLTYGELNDAVTRLAQRLCAAGVGLETLVGLYVERSCGMVIALLAILKAGGAYVPIDPALPRQRVALMLEDANAPVVLTEKALIAQLPASGARTVCIDDFSGRNDLSSADESGAPALPQVSTENLAYVIYTSGSTGKPKGVEISHKAVVNLLLAMQCEPGFAASDRMLAVTTLSFDIAALELYLPLISGGCVVIAAKEDPRDPERLSRLMSESRCTVMQATPATWRALVDSGWRGDPALKVLCGGEALPRDLAQQLLPRSRELWNMYGPTETTIWSTIHRISAQDRAIPIGRPVDNTDVFVLDANHNRLPAGVAGDLYIGGSGLARGYLRRAELTAERFIASPFDSGARLYRTGDLARWLPNGTLECLGRADNQVKIRGFRVEVEEIESAIAELPGVTGAAVKAWPDGSGGLTLSAYVCGAPGVDLRRALQHKLPEYMIPSRVVATDALPLTPNGKLDRNALPRPDALEASNRFVAPRNAVEQALAAIFASVLELDRVSVADNFFELGGHSLLVTKLLRRIELQFGKRLSMPAVFQSPTVQELAPFLEGQPGKSGSRVVGVRPRVVNIQTRNGRAPLFWVRGGPYLQTLQNRLETMLITVALDPSEEDDFGRTGTVPQMAACIVKRMLEMQPAGPYFLAGRCASGVIAIEAAVQLRASGHEVAMLALVESPNPAHYATIPRWRLKASLIAYHAGRLTGLRGASAVKYIYDRLKGAMKAISRTPEPADQTTCAVLQYTPEPYTGRMVVIQGKDSPAVPDLEKSWKDVATDKLEMYKVAGGHDSIFIEPQVQELSALLNDLLVEPAPSVTAREPRRLEGRSKTTGSV
jgi:amino acid adenylation domain-containing protein